MKKAPAAAPKEPRGDRTQHAAKVMAGLGALYPHAYCELEYKNPLELLVATILSAQCTDARVNLVTKDLFHTYRSAADFAEAPIDHLEKAIRSTGFFRNKAKAIQGACRMLLARHGGKVPRTMEELIELPGVARKTANVVLGNAFQTAVGIAVDTHVIRLSGRLGFTFETDPGKIERELMELLPRDQWIMASHRLIWHGRRVCNALRPDCAHCGVSELCPSAGKFGSPA